jgi:hypothetical protein
MPSLKKQDESNSIHPNFGGNWFGTQDSISANDTGTPIRMEIIQSGLLVQKITIFRAGKSGAFAANPDVEKTSLQIDPKTRTLSWQTDTVPPPLNCNSSFTIWEIKELKPDVLHFEEIKHITLHPFLPLAGGSLVKGLYFPPLTTTSYTGTLHRVPSSQKKDP